jgi:hypothetical protein
MAHQFKNPLPTVDCIIELPGERIVDVGERLDLAAAKAFPLDGLPTELCFDHGTILADYLTYKRTGQRRKL